MNYTMGTIDWTKAKELVTTNTWHAHLVHTVYEHNKAGRKIEVIEDTTRLFLVRINDDFLMQAFIESNYKTSDPKMINIMRMSINKSFYGSRYHYSRWNQYHQQGMETTQQ